MSTGDLKNSGTRLQSLLRTTKYPNDINYSFLFYGYPQEFLPLLHYLFQEYSLPYTKSLLKQGYEMSGKSDKLFMDTVYKVLRDEFGYVPKLGKEKFFCNGFTEQKLILTSTAYEYVINKCRSLRKQKSKSSSNKENANPNKVKRAVQENYASKVESETVPVAARKLVQPVPSSLLEHTPIRKAPQPNVSEPYNLSQDIEESIIEIPIEEFPAPCRTPTPPARIYSEEGAKEIYALDHLVANPLEMIDSTPKTVLTDVQLVHVAETPNNLPVRVTREVSTHRTKESEPCAQYCEKPPCCHTADIAEIKNMLITVNARLDILESKAKHSERHGLESFERHGLESFGVHAAPISNTVKEMHLGSKHVHQPLETNEPRQKSVTFDEQVTFDETKDSSSASTLIESGDGNENEDDIKNFLKSVQDRLKNTRSFLRTYDTS